MTRKDFADNAEEGYTAIVVAIALTSSNFIECDDVCISHVLGHVFCPSLTQKFMEHLDECPLAALKNFRWNAITIRGLS